LAVRQERTTARTAREHFVADLKVGYTVAHSFNNASAIVPGNHRKLFLGSQCFQIALPTLEVNRVE
jgi:hypothetical protein